MAAIFPFFFFSSFFSYGPVESGLFRFLLLGGRSSGHEKFSVPFPPLAPRVGIGIPFKKKIFFLFLFNPLFFVLFIFWGEGEGERKEELGWGRMRAHTYLSLRLFVCVFVVMFINAYLLPDSGVYYLVSSDYNVRYIISELLQGPWCGNCREPGCLSRLFLSCRNILVRLGA